MALIWCDLYSRIPDKVAPLYEAVFGWHVEGHEGMTCHSHSQPVARILKMPDPFFSTRLPSFWMPCFYTDDLNHSTKLAEQLGGKVEIAPAAPPAPIEDRFALIRDPLGAGFCLIEQPGFTLGTQEGEPHLGHLHVSDAAAILPFYSRLMQWRFTPLAGDAGCYDITSDDNPGRWGLLRELPDSIRGQYQYWTPGFVRHDIQAAARTCKHMGGSELADWRDHTGHHKLISDPEGSVCIMTNPG
ncbi:MAG: VOC family protein [Alphaproteobacteria bacterium]